MLLFTLILFADIGTIYKEKLLFLRITQELNMAAVQFCATGVDICGVWSATSGLEAVSNTVVALKAECMSTVELDKIRFSLIKLCFLYEINNTL